MVIRIVAVGTPVAKDPGGALGRMSRTQSFGLVGEGDVGVDLGHRLHDVDGLLAHDQQKMFQTGGLEGVDDANDGRDAGDGKTDLVVPGGAHAPTVSAAENDAGGLHLAWSCRPVPDRVQIPTKPGRKEESSLTGSAPEDSWKKQAFEPIWLQIHNQIVFGRGARYA